MKKNESSVNAALQFWENLTWLDLIEQFGKKIAQRGRDYADNGNVDSLWITEDKTTILAVVNGEHTYKTNVHLKQSGSSFNIESRCSCPYGSQCKHGAAAVAVYIDLYAKNKTVLTCKPINETTWDVETSDGKTLRREFDVNQNESSEERYNGTNDKGILDFLKQQIEKKSRKELAHYILQLAKKYPSFRKAIRKEYNTHSIAQINDADILLRKAVNIIKKQTNVERYYDDDDVPPIDLSEVLVIVKQFSKFNDPIAALTKIARQLFECAENCYEYPGVDDSCSIENVFKSIVQVVLKSQCNEVDIVLFACELRMMSGYGFADSEINSIFERSWSSDTWSAVADKLIEKYRDKLDYYPLRLIIQSLDNAHRQDDATDFLRSAAERTGEEHLLLRRLVEFEHLAEAEQLCLKWIKKDIQRGRFNLSRNNYIDFLEELAEKRKDWQTIASIQVSEFLEYPNLPKIKELLTTAQELKCKNAVRLKIEQFLLTGELPEAIAEAFNCKKPTKERLTERTFPELMLKTLTVKKEKRLDLLCEWAIAEKRLDDAIKWFDEFSKTKSSRHHVDLNKLADAVLNKYPARAVVFYQLLAEQKIQNAGDYYSAVDYLKKMRTALEKDNRLSEWDDVILEIRTVHKRKITLMPLLDELQGKSIVREKRQKK